MGIPAVGSSIAPTPTEAATASETSTIVATETPTSSTEEPTTTAKPGREPSDKVYRFNGAIWKTKRQDSYNTKAEGEGGGSISSLDRWRIRQLSKQRERVWGVQLFDGGGGDSEWTYYRPASCHISFWQTQNCGWIFRGRDDISVKFVMAILAYFLTFVTNILMYFLVKLDDIFFLNSSLKKSPM